jgi:phage terminase large subunit-like protein
MRERKMYPSIVVLKPITDKLARARALQGRMQQGMVSFNAAGEWYDDIRAEMLRFPAGVHDDQVDSLAWMTTMVVGRQAPRKKVAQQMKSWRDKLKGLGGTAGHMAS